MNVTETHIGFIDHVLDEACLGTPSATLKTVETALHRIISTLRASTSSNGEKFVELGTSLQGLYGECEALFHSSKAHTEMLRSGNAGRLLEEIADAAAQSVAALKGGQERILVLLGHIQDTIGVVKKLSKSVESITVVGTQLGIIGTNLAIQTSRLQSGVETFGDFASEIKSFSAYITRFASNIEQDTEDVVSILTDVKSRMEKRNTHMESYVDRAQTSGNQTISEIHTLIRQSADNVEQKSIHSETISKEVAKAVVAIQVDDITRQRLEHVVEALEEIVRVGNYSDGRMVLKLQAGQVREVSRNLAEAYDVMRGAFVDMGKEIAAISPVGAHSKADSGTSAATSLRNLQRTLSGLETIHEDARDLRQSMSQGLDRAILAAETISRHVVDVSTITQELNLKAINALLMSRQLGSDGGNLVVLAKELHTLSKDSIEFVTLVKEKIEHVAQVTTMLKKNALDEGEKENASHRFDTQIQKMDETVAFYDKASADSGNRAAQLQRHLLETESALSFMQDLAAHLAASARDIEQVVRMSESLSQTTNVDGEGVVHALYDKYTMEQERRVHRSVTGGSGMPETSAGASPLEEDELGNFELF